MDTENRIQLDGGTGRARAAAVAWGGGVLFMLLMAAVSLAVALGRHGLRSMWLAGIVALAGAALFARELRRLCTCVSGIGLDPSGGWHLYTPFGKKLALLPPETPRSLLLWADIRSRETAPYFDSLQGLLRLTNGLTYHLRVSQAFDLLIRLGYGAYWLDHDNITTSEEKRARELSAGMVYTGSKKSAGLNLPFHCFNREGIAAVEAFLAGRMRGS